MKREGRAHHAPDGRFRNPWPLGSEPPRSQIELLRWLWERVRGERAPDPEPSAVPRAEPEPARPSLPQETGEVRITWVGHATLLIQLPGVTLLTDPVFSRRASPVQWAGPRRFSPPGLTVEGLPTVHGVLLSHDHYDHLDRPSVEALRDRFGDDLPWFTPLGYTPWFRRLGGQNVVELDWWDETRLTAPDGGAARLQALPIRHWTRRRLFDARRRLWCSWGIRGGDRAVYFGGDSGYCPGFAEIGERAGPFDIALLPIGAYEPRWFMKPSHMNPEEAAQACRDARATAMVGMHWGTFRLTDEPPLEPPVRARRAWADLGLPADDLYIPALGQTLRFPTPDDRP